MAEQRQAEQSREEQRGEGAEEQAEQRWQRRQLWAVFRSRLQSPNAFLISAYQTEANKLTQNENWAQIYTCVQWAEKAAKPGKL